MSFCVLARASLHFLDMSVSYMYIHMYLITDTDLSWLLTLAIWVTSVTFHLSAYDEMHVAIFYKMHDFVLDKLDLRPLQETLKFPCGIIILSSSNSTWLFMCIILQLQTSDFVDVDFGCDHCPGSSETLIEPIFRAVLHRVPPPRGGQTCQIGSLEYSVRAQGS